MMRNKPLSSMQKTYDECYLTCSTAVFFEGQNNEAEALRSWKTALDQLYYHNAYRLPSGYIPRSETERALFDALKQMESQCKERVDLLEALKQSRKESGEEDNLLKVRQDKDKARSTENLPTRSSNWLGGNSVPPLQYSELPSSSPALPPRPSMTPRRSSNGISQRDSLQSASHVQSSPLASPPSLPIPTKQASRSPSPDQGRKALRTTLRPEKKGLRSSRISSNQPRRPTPMKAAGLAWDTNPRSYSQASIKPEPNPTIESRLSATAARRSVDAMPSQSFGNIVKMPDPADYIPNTHWRDTSNTEDEISLDQPMSQMKLDSGPGQSPYSSKKISEPTAPPPPPPPHGKSFTTVSDKQRDLSPPRLGKPPEMKYRKEYPPAVSKVPPALANQIMDKAYNRPSATTKGPDTVSRKPVPSGEVQKKKAARPARLSAESDSDEVTSKGKNPSRRPRTERKGSKAVTPPSTDAESPDDTESPKSEWDLRVEALMSNLPKGVDIFAAKQIINEIVVKGDEVHWEDVAGLNLAKKALKEAVVYPFLRPDLFMGLREPARGMLLFGPPGTGKTMLARAVATESRSCFFAISASSLTSKWHGDSEKLVRALFAMAKALAPSIIFVDEIDSLLSSRGGGSEHEASRRSKTEFLIQWSDLQRAAAGRDSDLGDASRVLVLAATNCPWDIDEAARRRFVRRQYIPLPEAETRQVQLKNLIGAQKHELSDRDITRLVTLTEGYSGSDITALAKDAAMGPLRNLGEELLFTPMENIRPIRMADFQASLLSIRPSVSKKGLEEFEQWARDFGERGG